MPTFRGLTQSPGSDEVERTRPVAGAGAELGRAGERHALVPPVAGANASERDALLERRESDGGLRGEPGPSDRRKGEREHAGVPRGPGDLEQSVRFPTRGVHVTDGQGEQRCERVQPSRDPPAAPPAAWTASWPSASSVNGVGGASLAEAHRAQHEIAPSRRPWRRRVGASVSSASPASCSAASRSSWCMRPVGRRDDDECSAGERGSACPWQQGFGPAAEVPPECGARSMPAR